MSRVTRQQAEFLYARGYRAENAPLDGPRAVRDLQWVYITITPAEMAGFHWAVWSKGMGSFLEGGYRGLPAVRCHQGGGVGGQGIHGGGVI